MARAKQPGLNGAGHSSNGEHSPPISAIGAIFSICGPKVCRCSPANLKIPSRQFKLTSSKGLFTHPLFFEGRSCQRTAGPELTFLLTKTLIG